MTSRIAIFFALGALAGAAEIGVTWSPGGGIPPGGLNNAVTLDSGDVVTPGGRYYKANANSQVYVEVTNATPDQVTLYYRVRISPTGEPYVRTEGVGAAFGDKSVTVAGGGTAQGNASAITHYYYVRGPSDPDTAHGELSGDPINAVTVVAVDFYSDPGYSFLIGTEFAAVLHSGSITYNQNASVAIDGPLVIPFSYGALPVSTPVQFQLELTVFEGGGHQTVALYVDGALKGAPFALPGGSEFGAFGWFVVGGVESPLTSVDGSLHGRPYEWRLEDGTVVASGTTPSYDPGAFDPETGFDGNSFSIVDAGFVRGDGFDDEQAESEADPRFYSVPEDPEAATATDFDRWDPGDLDANGLAGDPGNPDLADMSKGDFYDAFRTAMDDSGQGAPDPPSGSGMADILGGLDGGDASGMVGSLDGAGEAITGGVDSISGALVTGIPAMPALPSSNLGTVDGFDIDLPLLGTARVDWSPYLPAIQVCRDILLFIMSLGAWLVFTKIVRSSVV